MLYDIIPLIIILVCLTGIIIIYVKKIPYVSTIDIQQLPKEQQADVKKSLIEKRVEDKIKNLAVKIKNLFSPAVKFSVKYYQLIRGKIKKVEEEYKQKHLFLVKNQPQVAKQKIQDLLENGEKFIKEENLAEAEKKFIEIISLDPDNIDAYQNLGELYLKQKDFKHAEETFKHVLKLIIRSQRWWQGFRKNDKIVSASNINSQIASVYLDLGEVYQAMEDNEKALENYKKAAEIEPNNPRNLDFLIKIAIILNKKKIAQKFLQDLKKVNPNNEKIKEFEIQLKEL